MYICFQLQTLKLLTQREIFVVLFVHKSHLKRELENIINCNSSLILSSLQSLFKLQSLDPCKWFKQVLWSCTRYMTTNKTSHNVIFLHCEISYIGMMEKTYNIWKKRVMLRLILWKSMMDLKQGNTPITFLFQPYEQILIMLTVFGILWFFQHNHIQTWSPMAKFI